MKARSIRTRLATSFIAMLVISIAAFLFYLVLHNRSTIPVTSGYHLVKPDATLVWLCDQRNNIIVTEQIDMIGVSGQFIVGHITDAGEWADPHHDQPFPTGFFIVDTRRGTIDSGLTAVRRDEILGHSSVSLYTPMHWSVWHW